MKKLFRFFEGYRREVVIGPLFKVFEAVFELFIPLVVASIIDVGIPEKNTGYIVWAVLLMLALGIAGFSCTLVAQFCSAKAAAGFAMQLKSALLHHIQGFSFTETDKAGTNELITRMTGDVNQLQTGVNLFLRLFLRSPFIVFGAMVMAFTVDVPAAWIFVVTIPLLSVVVFGIMLLTMPMHKKVQKKLSEVLGHTRENLAGTRVIRAWNREDEEIQMFDRETDQLTRFQIRASRFSALMNPLTFVIVNTAIILLIHTGAFGVNTGRLAQGEVVALINYMSQILTELVKLASLIITVTKALASASRIEDVLETPSHNAPCGETPAIAPAERGRVTFQNVSLRYATAGAESLTDISFEAAPGETVGIIGGTGSGKSSLVELIPHFYEPTQGSVSVSGIPTDRFPEKDLRSRIGFVGQRAVLFRGTVRDNIRWGKADASDEEIIEALSAAQALDFVMAKPGGLDFVIEEGGKNLSGGQKQRLTIARALVRKPEILILDDSASALDYLTDLALRKRLAALDPKPTVFIISQRTTSVMNADKILVLDGGSLIGIGDHETLLKTCDVYREIYDSQFTKGEASV